MDNHSIRKLESDLWESADLLRAESKLISNQYCMPVLGLIFLRYAYSRFKLVEKEILEDRPTRGGRVLPKDYTIFADTLLSASLKWIGMTPLLPRYVAHLRSCCPAAQVRQMM